MSRHLIVKHIAPKTWWARAQWQLSENMMFNGVFVPKGFVTDGASTPLAIAWLVSPTGKAMRSAVVHDFLLQQLQKNESRRDADIKFLESLMIENVGTNRARLMFLAVRIFGIVKVAWYRLWH